MEQSGLSRLLKALLILGLIFLAPAIYTNYKRIKEEKRQEQVAVPARPPAKIHLVIENQPSTEPVSPLLFGINLGWSEMGHGLMENGDLLRDRSFRLQDSKMKVWTARPAQKTGGTIQHLATGGANSPYPGYLLFEQKDRGLHCIEQALPISVSAGQIFDLTFSSYGESSAPSLVAFFADEAQTPLSSTDEFITSSQGSWTKHAVEIRPNRASVKSVFRLCQATAGRVQIDEVRLRWSGRSPQVKSVAKTKLRQLGITALRWPGGSGIDVFDWKKSVGPLSSRDELVAPNGSPETPALGLHEFLDLCEELKITPLVQVNFLYGPNDAQNLIEYILGSADTPMGLLRANNGRTLPWQVTHFEIGNEPSPAYQGTQGPANAGSNYATLAQSVITAMRAKATSLGRTIRLGAAAETRATLADWLPNMPLLSNWNDQVFATHESFKQSMDFVHGHFYPYGGFDPNEAPRFQNLMSGGEVLKQTIANVRTKTASRPFWLTEFQVMLFGPDRVIKDAFLKDFQAGLAIGNIYMTLLQERAEGAFVFNFSQQAGFGLTISSQGFASRPAAHVLSLFAPLANAMPLSTKLTGSPSVRITNGVGNIPSRLSYETISAIAVQKAGGAGVSIVLLNRDYSKTEDVDIQWTGFQPQKATLHWYRNESLAANNETDVEAVLIQTETMAVGPTTTITLPAHSLVRIDLQSRAEQANQNDASAGFD